MPNIRTQHKLLTISSLATVFISVPVLADSEAEILERIRPIGKVNVTESIKKVVPVIASPKPNPTAPAAAPKPVATSAPVATLPAATSIAAATGPSAGQKTYDSMCFACHAVGAAGAPKFADKAAWAPRIAKGAEVLLHSAINGTAKGMPPRGGCGTCSDADLKSAVEYMTAHAK